MRRLPVVAASFLGLAACAPVVHPPRPPLGFLYPPRTIFSGVLSRAGAGTTPAGVGAFVAVSYEGEGRAQIRIGPSCELGARAVAAPYTEIPGIGYARQHDGALAFDAGVTCALDGSAAMTVSAGTGVVTTSGVLTLEVAGRDPLGLPASFRYSGMLVDERESDTPPKSTSVRVHLLAELVNICTYCRYNHTPIAQAGHFPFAPRLELQLPTPAGPKWSPICAAPCAASVDPRALLRVAGDGLPDSQPFSLPAGRPRVVLKASDTGAAAHAFGWTFVGAGAAFVGLGAGFFAMGRGEAGQDPKKARAAELGGAGFAVSSLAFFIPALIVLGHEGTTITTDRGETLAPR